MAALTIKIWNCSITQRSQLCYTSIITPFLYHLTVTHPFSISIILFHNCINGAASYVALTYWFLFTRHGWWYWTPLHMLMCTQIPFLVRCFRLDLVFYSSTLLTVLFVFFFLVNSEFFISFGYKSFVRYVICKYAFSICGLSF